jgi:hypothetical protein
MLFLIGIALAVPLLYFWLIGHWFTRVLVFLIFACVFGFTAFLTAQGGNHESPGGAFVAVVLSWPISGIPLYVRRYKARSTSMEMALR